MNRSPRQARPGSPPGLATWLLLVATSACATGAPSVPEPAELPSLEARLAQDSTDVATLVALGAGYRAAGEPDRARPLLESARELDPASGPAALFLGMTYEDLGLLSQALDVYGQYLEGDPPAQGRVRVEDRMALVRRRMVRETVRELVRGEAERPVSPTAVAVFPFVYAGSAPDYAPLTRALAAMLATDLSLTDRLTVVERLELQLLLDEAAMGQTALVDPATAVTPGRLVGAGQVVQGALGGDRETVTLEAAVVDVAGGTGDVRLDVSNEGAAADLLDLEKEMAFAVYEALGIELTAAERERVSERWTENVQALLQFGMGLEAEDRGDYAEARARFTQAASLDPGFDRAASRADAADRLSRATSAAMGGLEALAGTLGISGFQDLVTLEAALSGALELVPLPGGRDAIIELLGVEGFRPAALRIIVRPPGEGGG